MANIPILPDDVILNVFRFLDTQDRIAFAFSCERVRNLCMNQSRVFRKTDLSRHTVSTTQRGAVNEFFRDRQLTQHIRELNISNLHVLNWQMDDHVIEEFIISICPHLEALHVLNCGMRLQRLHHILKQAPKLAALSWSLWDFTSEDIQFLVSSMESSTGVCLKNIKRLHLEILISKSHIQIAKYLLLSCFSDLEELEIYIWWIDMEYCTGWNLPLAADQLILGFPQPSAENQLQHLHSLMAVAVGGPLSEIDDDDDDHDHDTYEEELYDFVISVLKRKSTLTKWKKFWISPSTHVGIRNPAAFSRLLHKDDFQSVETITADLSWSVSAMDKGKTLFKRIGDNAIRSLHLCLPYCGNSIVEICDPISRVGGHSLKFLRLSAPYVDEICAEQNDFIHSLFSVCSNITELDLLSCSYEKGICEPLSELKHLTKVQLTQCAISSKRVEYTKFEISKANLLVFVENCKNITHLDIRGCDDGYVCRLTDDDLLALAKLRNLKSLTLYKISGIREWHFLKNISEQCKFLTTLRIRLGKKDFKDSHIEILMESVKFLKHFALDVRELDEERIEIGSESFWVLLSRAKNLQRLCIRSSGMLNIFLAVQTLKCLPQLHVFHLHCDNIQNIEVFHSQIKGMLEERESDSRFSFEIVTGNRRNTWISQQTGYSLISRKSLPLNEAELCNMRPILDIPSS